MGLRRRLADAAARRPRCYVVEAPGGHEVRWAVEDAVDGRGWTAVASPAHADALVIAGDLPDELDLAADVLWSQLPGPRCRVHLARKAEVDAALDALSDELGEPASRRSHPAGRREEVRRWLDQTDGSSADEKQHEDGGHDHGEHDHEGMRPSGIRLAEGAEDRDGLEMDVLVHPWGPLLDRWPGGLELRLSLHGDVIVSAESHWWPAAAASTTPTRSVAGWDAVATTMSLLGDERSARLARRARAGEAGPAEAVRASVRRLRRWRVLPSGAAELLLELTGPHPETASPSVDPADLVRGHELVDARLLVAAHAPLLLHPVLSAGGTHG